MARFVPFVEEGAFDGVPVPVEPGPHQRLLADELQAMHIVRVELEQELIVGKPRGDDRDLMGRAVLQRLRQHLRRLGKGHHLVAIADPALPGAAGIARQHELGRHAGRGAQRPEQAKDRVGRGILTGFLDPGVGEVAALIFLRVRDAVEIAEADPPAVRHAPEELRLVELPPERPIDLLRALDGVGARDGGAAEHHGTEGRAVALLLQGPFAEHPIRLAAAARAAEEHLRERAIDERLLRAGLRPPDDLNGRLAYRSSHCASVIGSSLTT